MTNTELRSKFEEIQSLANNFATVFNSFIGPIADKEKSSVLQINLYEANRRLEDTLYRIGNTFAILSQRTEEAMDALAQQAAANGGKATVKL